MPQLPSYTSQQSINTRQTGTGAHGALVGATAKPIRDLGETLEGIGDNWLRATVNNQYTTASNENDAEINALLEKAQDETDHTQQQRYLEQIKLIREKEVTINDVDVQDRFNLENQHALDQAEIKVNGYFKQKMIGHQRREIVTRSSNYKKKYMQQTTGWQTTSVMEQAAADSRNKILADHLEKLDADRKSGFLSDKEYASEIEDTKEWEYDRALKDIGDDPELAAQRLAAGSYRIDDVKKVNDLIQTAKTTQSRRKTVKEVASLSRYTKAQDILKKDLYENPTASLSQKILMIDEAANKDEVSEKWAKDHIDYLKKVDSAKSVTSNKVMNDYIETITDLNKNYDSTSSSLSRDKDYLTALQNLQTRIGTERELTDKDKQGVLNLLTTRSAGRQAESTQGIGRKKAGEDDNSALWQASQHYKKSIPLFRNEAVRQYFYKLRDNPNMDETQKRRALHEIEDNLTLKHKPAILGQVRAYRKKFPKASIDFVQDKKTGAFFVEIIPEGKTRKKGGVRRPVFSGTPEEIKQQYQDYADTLTKRRAEAKIKKRKAAEKRAESDAEIERLSKIQIKSSGSGVYDAPGGN